MALCCQPLSLPLLLLLEHSYIGAHTGLDLLNAGCTPEVDVAEEQTSLQQGS
jgi:hypothetical protein